MRQNVFHVHPGRHLGRHFGRGRKYIFNKCFIVFLDPENHIIDTRINVEDTIDVELCAKMYVASNSQYGRHLEIWQVTVFKNI